jgi:hypothetical protein
MARISDEILPRGPVRCPERWPYDEPRDQCSLNSWHSGPHKTYHEDSPHTGKDKHIWPNANDKTMPQP